MPMQSSSISHRQAANYQAVKKLIFNYCFYGLILSANASDFLVSIFKFYTCFFSSKRTVYFYSFLTRIEGDWIFTDFGNGQTKIEWTYKIVPRNVFARGAIKLFLLKNVGSLLTKALTILKADLEKVNDKKEKE